MTVRKLRSTLLTNSITPTNQYVDCPLAAEAAGRHKSSSTLRSATHWKMWSRMKAFSIAVLLAATLTPTVALFDPGEPVTAVAAEDPVDHVSSTLSLPRTSKSALPSGKLPDLTAKHDDLSLNSAKLSTDLVSLAREPVSLHPDCRKVTDLFDNVCPSPWTPWSTASPLPRSELVICPLPPSAAADQDTNAGPRERVYAITGTITLPHHALPDLSSNSAVRNLKHGLIVEQHANKWPNPGDEGFWRQRGGGEVEWVPTEPRALLEADPMHPKVHDISSPQRNEDDTTIAPEQLAEAVQAKEYDAWSERIGGEESDTWLGFEQWRDKHLAAEREKAEQERQRITASKRSKSDKHKASASSTNVALSDASNGASATLLSNSPEQRAEEDRQSHSYEDRNNNTVSAIAPINHETDAVTADSFERDNVKQPREAPETIETNAAEQGAIPALGNPSDELGNLKHRWNFASLDCAAVVHRTNPSAKFSSSILSEKKDRYLLSPCPISSGEQQFVVVELCDEIKIDTLVMANFEFFSRMFKRFRVHVSRNLNGGNDEWVDVGTFRARNVRGLQVFKTVNPSGDARFFRYVRIDFLEHYGSEYYCPLSLLRVYGLTQMDDYIREEEEMRKAREAESRMLSEASSDEEEDEADPRSTVDTDSTEQKGPPDAAAVIDTTSSVSQLGAEATGFESDVIAGDAISALTDDVFSHANASLRTSTEAERSHPYADASPSVQMNRTDIVQSVNSSAALPKSVSQASSPAAQNASANAVRTATSVEAHSSIPIGKETDTEASTKLAKSDSSRFSVTYEQSSNQPHHTMSQGPTDGASQLSSAPAMEDGTSSSTSSGGHETYSSSSSLATSLASAVPLPSSSLSASATSTTSVSPPAPSSPGTVGNSTTHQQHGGSESIYRTITKRLNMLEANATLSFQYMEHTRQSLRETFARMERNQRDKIGQMLRDLNASNWRQIESLKRRQQVDLQQALFEFDMHRQQTDAERRALLAQVHMLSNEIMLEKRFGIAQLILLLGLFVFMALTRGSRAAPLINQGLARLSRTSSSMRFNGGDTHGNQQRRKRGSTADSLRSSDATSSSPSSEQIWRYRSADVQRHSSFQRRAAAADMVDRHAAYLPARRLPETIRRKLHEIPPSKAQASYRRRRSPLAGGGDMRRSNGETHLSYRLPFSQERNTIRRPGGMGGTGMLEYVVRMRGGINAKVPLQRRVRTIPKCGIRVDQRSSL